LSFCQGGAAADTLSQALEQLASGEHSLAYESLSALADSGSSRAQMAIAFMHERGYGVSPSSRNATTWLRRAADSGLAAAQYEMGVRHYQGHGVARDNAKARQWWEKAAETGVADAQYNTGLLATLGIGGTRDPIIGPQWFLRAAAQEHALAAYSLSVIYASGDGVSADRKEARRWFEQAAIGGAASGQYNLGLLLEETDSRAALKWYQAAAAQGLDEAQLKVAAATLKSPDDSAGGSPSEDASVLERKIASAPVAVPTPPAGNPKSTATKQATPRSATASITSTRAADVSDPSPPMTTGKVEASNERTAPSPQVANTAERAQPGGPAMVLPAKSRTESTPDALVAMRQAPRPNRNEFESSGEVTQEITPAPASEITPETTRGEQCIFAQPRQNFTVQLATVRRKESIVNFVNTTRLPYEAARGSGATPRSSKSWKAVDNSHRRRVTNVAYSGQK